MSSGEPSPISVTRHAQFTKHRSLSLPAPGIFLASNVNSQRVTSICNIILGVLLFLGVLGVVGLAVYSVMSWVTKETAAVKSEGSNMYQLQELTKNMVDVSNNCIRCCCFQYWTITNVLAKS
jgi:hypothetical protein